MLILVFNGVGVELVNRGTTRLKCLVGTVGTASIRADGDIGRFVCH